MHIRGRNLDEMTGEALATLIADGTPESLTLEFKSALPGASETGRPRFIPLQCQRVCQH